MFVSLTAASSASGCRAIFLAWTEPIKPVPMTATFSIYYSYSFSSPDRLNLRPCATGRVGPHRAFHKGYPAYSIGYIRKTEIRFCPGFAFRLGQKSVRGFCIEISKRFKESFRMPEPCTCPTPCIRQQPVRPLRKYLGSPIDRTVAQVVRILMMPGQAAPISVNANSKAVLIAGGGHRCPERSTCAIGKAQQQI